MDTLRIQALGKQLSFPCIIEDSADLFYLTGLELSKGRLLVRKEDATLYVDGRYFAAAKQKAVCQVALWDEFKQVKEQKIGFDSATMTYDAYLVLQKTLPHVEWMAMSAPVKHLRAVKDVNEIAALNKAQALTLRGIQRVKELFREGVTEEELAFEFEFFCRKEGASGLSFESIIAFGEHGAYPHYRTSKAPLKKGQMVLIDAGAIVDHYHGDMTRVFSFGAPDPRVMQFELLVRQVQRQAIEMVKPGVLLGALDQAVQDSFEKANVKQLYMHSLGHGIGLETHEYPRLRFDGEDRALRLEPGMVFTIEPGLYQPGLGGIRIEDMILVTNTGYKILGHAGF